MRIAIIGAGLAGLTAGRQLAAQGHEIEIFEKSKGLGGRAATRRLHGCLLDHGAQYAKTPDEHPAVARLLLHDLPREGLIDIQRPVWIFNGTGEIAPGDPEQNSTPKWSYATGLNELGKRLGVGLTIHRQCRITSLNATPTGYSLHDESGARRAEAECVLMAIPAGQAVELLQASQIAEARRSAALHHLQSVSYRRIHSVLLGSPLPPAGSIFAAGTMADPRPYYALINTDRQHAISWLAFENDKGPERTPPDTLALVVQMAPAFSLEHWETPVDELIPLVTAQVSTLLQYDLSRLLWYDVARWRYALPDSTCDLGALNHEAAGLYFVGDYVAGGRVHLAIQAGFDVAALITAS